MLVKMLLLSLYCIEAYSLRVEWKREVFVGQGEQATGIIWAIRGLSRKVDSRNYKKFTRIGLKLVSVYQEPPHVFGLWDETEYLKNRIPLPFYCINKTILCKHKTIAVCNWPIMYSNKYNCRWMLRYRKNKSDKWRI